MQPVLSFSGLIIPFAAKIKTITTAGLPMSDYSKRYLDHLLAHHIYYLNIYAHVLDNVVQHSAKMPQHITLVDYGAGNGLLGIFAKYCGFKKIFICDTDALFTDASKILAAQLNIYIDKFITGDIETLQQAVANQTIDAVAGTDVIEHIYNLDVFFAGIKKMNPAMITVFTTASNPHNFIKTRHLKKLQLKDELQGSSPDDFILAGSEKHNSFIKMREKIIAQNFPQLLSEDLLSLSKNTRGLYYPDIITAVQKFVQTGQMPTPDEASKNTCNPTSGSWTERILSINQYQAIYAAQGYRLQVNNGFYNAFTPGIKKYVNGLLNIIVKITGKTAAPFITLIGYRQG